MLWFVLITAIATEPAVRGTPMFVPGDVITSKLLGAADTEEKCLKGGALLGDALEKAGQGSVVVINSCVQMDASVGNFQGFIPIADVP